MLYRLLFSFVLVASFSVNHANASEYSCGIPTYSPEDPNDHWKHVGNVSAPSSDTTSQIDALCNESFPANCNPHKCYCTNCPGR